jgi:hypothetical protein
MPTHKPKKENDVGKSNVTPPEGAKKKTAKKAASGDKKPRAPRKDYGFTKGATIQLTDGEKTYRGNRLRWYGYLTKADGKPVEAFEALAKKAEEKEGARGWLRFFVENEACTLTAPAEA